MSFISKTLLIFFISSPLIAMDVPSLLTKKRRKVLVPQTEPAKELYALAQQQIDAQQDLDAPILNNRPLLVTSSLSDEHLATTWLLLYHGAQADVRCPIGKTPLLYAAQSKNASKTIGVLVYFGADPNHPSYQQLSDKKTPLHALCEKSQDSFDRKKIKARQNAVEWLLAANALPNAKDSEGRTPLFPLCLAGHKVSSLLEETQKSLFYKARRELITALLMCKANPNICNKWGRNMYHQTLDSVDSYLSIHTAMTFRKVKNEFLREIFLKFLKTSPQKPDAQSPFKRIPYDILKHILEFAYK